MKLKYYLRGLGVGIFTATILLAIAFFVTDGGMSDEEIMERAARLGMVMPDGETEEAETQTTEARTTETDDAAETPQDTETEQNNTEDSETPDGADNGDGAATTSSEATDTSDNAQTPETTDTPDNAQTADTSENAGDGTAASSEEAETPDNATDTDTAENIAVDTRERCTFVVNSGEVCRIICNRLAEAGVVDDAEALRSYLAEKGFANSIIAGTYSIPYGASNEEVYEILLQGPA